jgi:hypothetical protein
MGWTIFSVHCLEGPLCTERISLCRSAIVFIDIDTLTDSLSHIVVGLGPLTVVDLIVVLMALEDGLGHGIHIQLAGKGVARLSVARANEGFASSKSFDASRIEWVEAADHDVRLVVEEVDVLDRAFERADEGPPFVVLDQGVEGVQQLLGLAVVEMEAGLRVALPDLLHGQAEVEGVALATPVLDIEDGRRA